LSLGLFVCRLAAGTATVRTSRPKGDEDGDADDDDDDAEAVAVAGAADAGAEEAANEPSRKTRRTTQQI
jgi:hypothetical protein